MGTGWLRREDIRVARVEDGNGLIADSEYTALTARNFRELSKVNNKASK